jgi:hypothetical protein
MRWVSPVSSRGHTTLWVKPDQVPPETSNSALLSKYRHFVVPESNFYASLFRRSDGTIITRLTANGTDVVDVAAGQVGVWQHYAFVMPGPPRPSRIYRNGVLIGAGPLTYNDTVSSEPLRIGVIVGDVEDQTFSGAIDDVRVYDKALTSAEVARTQLPPR